MRNKVVSIALGITLSTSAVGIMADENDPVLIKRGAVEITESEYSLLTRSILDDDQREQLFSNETKMQELLLDYLITRTLAQEAMDLELDQKPEIQFQREYNAARLLAQARMQHVQKEAEPLDYETLAREQYIAERTSFKAPEMVSVEHILVAVNDERSASEAEERVKEVETKLVSGADFADLAAEYSDDPSSATNKGNLGYFGRNQMVKPFEEAAFAMTEPGETAVVKTNYGYHLIRYIGRRDERVRTFDEVKDRLIDQQRQKHMAALAQKKISDIRQSNNIIVDFEAVDSFFNEGQRSLQGTD